MRRVFRVAAAAIGLAFAGSIGAAEPSKCALVRVAEWPVRLEHNKLIVDGAVNGQKVGIMLDTGAARSMILRSAATRLGLPMRQARGYRMFGIGGETYVEAARIDEFSIGQAARKGWSVVVAGERSLGRDVVFILGEDFFHDVDVEFDLAHHAVRLFQPRDCDGVALAYWALNGASEVEIERISSQAQILLTVQINGQPVTALLDSGAGASVLTLRDAARLGVTPETPGVVAGGRSAGLGQKSVENWIGPFASFAIGNETIRDTKIRFADIWKDATYTPVASHLAKRLEGLPAMLLGADFLHAHRVLVAHSQRKMYFTYAGGPVFALTGPLDSRSDSGEAGDGAKPASGEN